MIERSHDGLVCISTLECSCHIVQFRTISAHGAHLQWETKGNAGKDVDPDPERKLIELLRWTKVLTAFVVFANKGNGHWHGSFCLVYCRL